MKSPSAGILRSGGIISMSLERAFSIYIHYPFCVSKCGYCDFVSRAGADAQERARHEDLIIREIRGAAARGAAPAGAPAHTVYFGGGTPSLMSPATLKRIIYEIDNCFGIARGAEISAESNPGSVKQAESWLAGAREAGINRLNVGVQSFDDKEIVFLGRAHNARQSAEFFNAARRAGFNSVGLDLIYGLPEQPLERWRITLESAVSLSPDHISLYCLETPPGTRLAADIEAGAIPPTNGDAQADMYLAACDALDAADYLCYEISNFARDGHECRHNMVYWTGGDYLGVGVSACSYLGGERIENERDFARYEEKVSRGERPVRSAERLSYPRRLRERAAMALRTSAGFALPETHSFHARALAQDLEDLAAEGFLVKKQNGAYALKPEYRFISDSVFRRLI